MFDYNMAFSRNLGWITEEELQLLRKKRVAIAGLGGVGGHYVEVLARLGVGGFHIADFDRFEIQNFNRQAGAVVSTIGQLKSEVMKKRILDINPTAEVKVFPEGVTEKNLKEFLDVDLYVDGLDIFVLDLRQTIFEYCHRFEIPAITVGPLGMGAAMVLFDKNSMSFKDYFGLSSDCKLTEVEKLTRFLVGLAPSLQHSRYLVDKTRLNLKEQRGPSTPMGCYLCAGVLGTEVLKVLLDRGPRYRAPWSVHYDGYLNRLQKRWTPFGFNNPLQRLRAWIIGVLFNKS